MTFDRRGMRIDVTYRLLEEFARRLNYPLDTGSNQINIIVLRGAKPVDRSALNDDLIDTLEEIKGQIADYDKLHEFQRDVRELTEKQENLMRNIIRIHEIKPEDEKTVARIAKIATCLPLAMGLQLYVLRGIPMILNCIIPKRLERWAGGEKEARHTLMNVLRKKQKEADEKLNLAKSHCGSESDFKELKGIIEKQTNIANETHKLLVGSEKEMARVEDLLEKNIQDISCTIELADNVMDQYNDTVILMWKDERGLPHVRALLGSADPGSYYIEHASDEGYPGAASISPGTYTGTWISHRGFRALQIKTKDRSDTLSGRRITGYDIDKKGTEARSDDVINITEYTYYSDSSRLEGIRLHAGGSPPSIIFNWSAGCILIAGGKSESYRQVVGRDKSDIPDTWLGMDKRLEDESQISFNIIVWNAWTLYELDKARRGKNFRPIIEFGAQDLPETFASYEGDPGAVRWVTRMQERLNAQIPKLTERWGDIKVLFERERKQLSKQFPLFIKPNMELPTLAGVAEKGKFENDTGASLRTFQLVCFLLLGDVNLRLKGSGGTNRDEIMWERNQWLCGPETWKLLDARNLRVTGRSS